MHTLAATLLLQQLSKIVFTLFGADLSTLSGCLDASMLVLKASTYCKCEKCPFYLSSFINVAANTRTGGQEDRRTGGDERTGCKVRQGQSSLAASKAQIFGLFWKHSPSIGAVRMKSKAVASFDVVKICRVDAPKCCQ